MPELPDVDIEEEKETDKIRVNFKDAKEITITYQTVQDLSRVENNRAELQKLSDSFYIDLIQYLTDKKKILDMPSEGDLFSSTEKENTRIQLDNVMRLLDKLYDKRERKIINMAIDKSRVGGSLIDTSPLLKEEANLFNDLSGVLKRYRLGILESIKEYKKPIIEQQNEVSEPKKESPKVSNTETTLVRFLSAVPKFVGEDLDSIGPFDEEDVANLPKDIAEVLIKKGRAEAIDEEI